MNIFEFFTICPPEIKELALSDTPAQILIALDSQYGLNPEQGDGLVNLTRNVLLGLVSVESLHGRLQKIIPADLAKLAQVETSFRQHMITPYLKFLHQTEDDVRKFKADNNLPEVVIFTVPKLKKTVPMTPEPVRPSPQGPVPTTADIRRPIKRVVPPATPVQLRPEAAEGPPPVKEEKPRHPAPREGGLDQFQLRSVDDLINVPPVVLAKEPDDEKQLVGRFKQEIQDIANYSGAKRTDIVAGWKKSRIYHTYIEMGNDSIQQGKPISDVMAFRKAGGKPYLSENQFHAISEVSRLLLR